MIEIQAGSEAYGVLRQLLSMPDTEVIRISEHEEGVTLKRNGGIWSPVLATVPDPSGPVRRWGFFELAMEEDLNQPRPGSLYRRIEP